MSLNCVWPCRILQSYTVPQPSWEIPPRNSDSDPHGAVKSVGPTAQAVCKIKVRTNQVCGFNDCGQTMVQMNSRILWRLLLGLPMEA